MTETPTIAPNNAAGSLPPVARRTTRVSPLRVLILLVVGLCVTPLQAMVATKG